MFKTAQIIGLTAVVALTSILFPGSARAGQTTLYVTNEFGGTVSEYSTSGAYLGNFATGLADPTGITTNRAGDVFVSNFSASAPSIQEYSPQGTLLMTISLPYQPGDARIEANGNILVLDYFGGSIYQYSPTGQSLGLFANPGLERADTLALDSQGNL